MLGLMINDMEKRELEYLIKRELDEIIFDLDDHRIDHLVKNAMRDRYKTLFQLLRRVSTDKECLRYIPKRTKNE
ncbi:hypothetical protein [Ornithinibacillus bavariensis]|uniref:Uncharacterized protein n=1 Tax=Ornithinibacillus bavariensis TaxID=545502 RepID=A0A919XDQ4_9BACI|nr:hypothetical protein [Ornithinibacillus bavariensis]GIO28730.1 hypothetical protein J43TS3_33410 [Ornithinibacillus bavariensis]